MSSEMNRVRRGASRSRAPAGETRSGNADRFVPVGEFRERYYARLVARIQEAISVELPEGATVLVVSRGDDSLLPLGNCCGWHFPRAGNHAYAGHHPANSASAISHLEDLRAEGADFILFPATSQWWFEYYNDFYVYLRQNYELAAESQDEYTVYDLRRRRASTKRAPVRSRPRATSVTAAASPRRRHGGGERCDAQEVGKTGDQASVSSRHVLLGWFDPDFYKARYPEVEGSPASLLDHYLEHGWREGRDPCAWFSTTYYLSRYEDIREAGLNPFVHYLQYGQAEGRLSSDYRSLVRRKGYRPTVSAIVPNYNHARFLPQRLASIATQTYKPAELIVLDDASTDTSREVISAAVRDLDIPVRTVYNTKRSGNVFRQWRAGLAMAEGDLVWICESDDFCDECFLERLVPYFGDPSVTLAFGRIQFADEEGAPDDWLDGYRERARPGYWDQPRVESAYEWFRGPFALANVIPNVGGALFRRQDFGSHVWKAAQRFSVCGDWYLYMQIARSGRIAYEPTAFSYFRQHGGNTSVLSFDELAYYREHGRIAAELRRMYGASDDALWALYQRVREHYLRHFPAETTHRLHQAFRLQRLLEGSREVRNILIGILGFRTGGAEIFPIHLANTLAERGHNVSILVLESEGENPEIRRLLRPGLPVYERAAVEDVGAAAFFRASHFDVVHSHYQGVDLWASDACRANNIPYVVTLHGSHEVAGLDAETRRKLVATVDHWVYTADKNLGIFDGISPNGGTVTKLSNAVPERAGKFPFARDDLAPGAETVLFGLATRALRAKGWEVAMDALDMVRRKVRRSVYLALCGDGEEYAELLRLHGNRAGVTFLGFQAEITAFYRLCDCCLLPTRFPGESFPFTLIESLKAGTPIIATDVGEIRNVIDSGTASAGIAIPWSDDDAAFTRALSDAMLMMLDDKKRLKWSENAATFGTTYSFDALTSAYESIYETVQR